MTETVNMTIKGFTVVPVKASEDRARVQYLYLRRMERSPITDELKPADRTVYIGNTPAWASEIDFEHAFSCCGKVEKVILQHAPSRAKGEEDTHLPTSCKRSHRFGFVIFKTKDAVNKAEELSYHAPLVFKSGSKFQQGLSRYKEQYLKSHLLDMEATKKQLSEKMAQYDQKEKEKEEAAKNTAPDEEGWITVTRVGKNKGAPRTEVEDTRVKTKESRKRKRKELLNFYSFQKRETQRQRIEELRKQFQQDKSTIEKMKKDRKFRPF